MRLQGWRAVLAAAPLAVLPLVLTSCDDNNATNATAAVSTTTVSVAPVSGASSTPFVFTGQITTTGSTQVTYRWAHDDGTTTPVATLSFDGASTETVTHTWDSVSCSTSDSSHWAQLQVLTPNAMNSTQIAITVNKAVSCP